MGTLFRSLRLLAFGVILVGCASAPTLSHNEIARIHTARVVYIRQQPDFAILQDDHRLGVPVVVALNIGLGLGSALIGSVLLTPAIVDTDPESTNEFLSQYRDAISTSHLQQRLREAVDDVIPRVPWLKGVTPEVRDTPMTAHEMQKYAWDTGVDAVIFFYPVSGLYIDGTHLYAYVRVVVYVNPHGGQAPFEYDSAELGCLCKLVIPDQDPKQAYQSIYAISPKQRFQVWFANDAAVLRQDSDLGVSQAHDELAHYLGALPATKAP
jgi:hypothetical protein